MAGPIASRQAIAPQPHSSHLLAARCISDNRAQSAAWHSAVHLSPLHHIELEPQPAAAACARCRLGHFPKAAGRHGGQNIHSAGTGASPRHLQHRGASKGYGGGTKGFMGHNFLGALDAAGGWVLPAVSCDASRLLLSSETGALTASSPSGCASRCIAIGATSTGDASLRPAQCRHSVRGAAGSDCRAEGRARPTPPCPPVNRRLCLANRPNQGCHTAKPLPHPAE